MLHIDIHNEETGEAIRVGTLEEFVNLLIAEIGSVAHVLLKSQFKKKALSSLDRVIQRARDNAK